MPDKSPHIDMPATSAPAKGPVTHVEKGADEKAGKKAPLEREPSALDPTRYGDWEKNGRCIDF